MRTDSLGIKCRAFKYKVLHLVNLFCSINKSTQYHKSEKNTEFQKVPFQFSPFFELVFITPENVSQSLQYFQDPLENVELIYTRYIDLVSTLTKELNYVHKAFN